MLRDLKNLSNSNNETSLFTINQNSKKVFDNPSFSSFKENAFITNEDDESNDEESDDDSAGDEDEDEDSNVDNSANQQESNLHVSDTVMDSGIAYKLNNNIKLDDILPAYKRINSDTQRSPNINEITSLTENRMKISNQKMSVQSGDYEDENLLNKVNSRDLVPVEGNADQVEDKIKMIQKQAGKNENEKNNRDRESKNNY